MKRFWHNLLILLGVSALAACGDHDSNNGVKTMLKQSYPDAQPYCIGRFLVELPPFVSLTNGDSRYDGVSIEVSRQAKSRFEQMVDKEIDDREKAGQKYAKYISTVDKLKSIEDLDNGHLIRYGDSRYTGSLAYINISDTTWKMDGGSDKKIDVANRIEFRPEPGPDAVPEDKGYCIMYGFIPEKAPTNNEWENRYFKQKGNPEFNLSIEISNIGKERQSLSDLEEERSGISAQLLSAGQIDYEKKAEPIELGGISGEQSIVDMKDDTGWRYNLISSGQVSDPVHPFIQVLMRSGNMKKEEADKLWYSILGSLRPRPDAF